MGNPRYGRMAFWLVKVMMLLSALIVIWNVAKETGRQEILSRRAVQHLVNKNPFCIWGGIVYPATEINTRNMTVKIKKDQGGN